LRELINRKRGFKSIRQVAVECGVAHVTLSRFLNGKTSDLHVETCLRLAPWLGLSRGLVLRMAGHNDIAEALSMEEVTPPLDHIEEQMRIELSDLTPVERQAILRVVQANATILRDNRATFDTPNIIGK